MKYEHDSWENCASPMKRTHNFFSAAHFAMPLLTVNCQLSTVNWIHTLSAKEKDTETCLSYFGARYYSSDLSIWLSVDPMSDKYPSTSSYAYCRNNPIILVDPSGMDDYEIFINKDGNAEINVTRNDNKTNTYAFIENGERHDLGTYDKTGSLVQLDQNNDNYEQVNYSQGRTYMDGDVAAGFLGAAYVYKKETGRKVIITQLNNSEGGHSSHTGKGTNADVRYAGKDGCENKQAVWTNSKNFDKSNSQKLADAFYKFGFNSPKGSILTENGDGTGTALDHSIFVDGKGNFHHKHHMHLQKFNTSIIHTK